MPDSARGPAVHESSVGFARLLVGQVVVLLVRHTHELKTLAELSQYATTLLQEAKEMHLADTQAGKNAGPGAQPPEGQTSSAPASSTRIAQRWKARPPRRSSTSRFSPSCRTRTPFATRSRRRRRQMTEGDLPHHRGSVLAPARCAPGATMPACRSHAGRFSRRRPPDLRSPRWAPARARSRRRRAIRSVLGMIGVGGMGTGRLREFLKHPDVRIAGHLRRRPAPCRSRHRAWSTDRGGYKPTGVRRFPATARRTRTSTPSRSSRPITGTPFRPCARSRPARTSSSRSPSATAWPKDGRWPTRRRSTSASARWATTSTTTGRNYRRVVEIVQSGKLGRITHVHCWKTSPTEPHTTDEPADAAGRARLRLLARSGAEAPVRSACARTSRSATSGTTRAARSSTSGATSWTSRCGRST